MLAVPFFEVFDKIDKNKFPCVDADIISAVLNREERSLNIELNCKTFMDDSVLAQIENALKEIYGLEKINIKTHFLSESFSALSVEKSCKSFFADKPAILAIIKNADFDENKISVKVNKVTIESIKKDISALELILKEKFGRDISVELIELKENMENIILENKSMREKKIEDIKLSNPVKEKKEKKDIPEAYLGRVMSGTPMEISKLEAEMPKVMVTGVVFDKEIKDIKARGAVVVNFDITDNKNSVTISKFMDKKEGTALLDKIQKNTWITVVGKVKFDTYNKCLVIDPISIYSAKSIQRIDTYEGKKRVELHLHTNMSSMDATTSPELLLKTLSSWGHSAVAITDHGVVQAYPEAMKYAAKNGIKVLYGMEGYFVNDTDSITAVGGEDDFSLDDEFVAFDLETTGLDAHSGDEIIEFAAVKYKGGIITDEFSSFVNVGRKLPYKIIELTGIHDSDLVDAPKIREVMTDFLKFTGDLPLAAHNAPFDVSFLNETCRRLGIDKKFTFFDTCAASRSLLKGLEKYTLDSVADALSLPPFNHHRALDDAKTVAYILPHLIKKLKEIGCVRIQEVNNALYNRITPSEIKGKAFHIILIAKNTDGLFNLYKMVSESNLTYFRKNFPIIPKSLLLKYRDNIVVGSACEAGELFTAVTKNRPYHELCKIAKFYDYLEIQPIANNNFMLYNNMAQSEEELRDFNRKIIKLGEDLNLPVCATGDVHFLNPEDEIFRRILQNSKGYSNVDRPLPLYLRTTEDMLDEFSYLGEEKAYEVVVENTNLIADMCDKFDPIKSGTFEPTLENSAEELKALCNNRVHELYGDDVPQEITTRMEKELSGIIGKSYDVIYIIAQKLVSESNKSGYLVGSRGSVGSSIIAYLSGITEVNSLPPHYRCPKCKNTEFSSTDLYACGFDMPDKMCPKCGTKFLKDGFNIPFATFLGFYADKKPDIDLNFSSGDDQKRAHNQTIEMFGEKNVYRAGTISTVAEKTAYGYVKKYNEERGLTVSKAEEKRLAWGCMGVKRTTGQHPGGLIIVPKEYDINMFTPVQHPADDADSTIITTHFDYHSIEENLLKLDELGHDDPRMLRMLADLTGVDIQNIPIDDEKVMNLFLSPKDLGIEEDNIIGSTGACAIPEFGTNFVRGILKKTAPTTIDELVKISGLSHGTDVWLGNASELIDNNICTLKDVISCRDDITTYLISKGIEQKMAFTISESVRKGKGFKGKGLDGVDVIKLLKEHDVPDWYMDSCEKIKYMFPKAHAAAYVMMALRIAWFKVYHPLAFYAAYFSIRANGFDIDIMANGIEKVKMKILELRDKPTITKLESDTLVTGEVVYEFYKRGFKFKPVDIYKSDSINFLIEDDSLRLPFVAIAGMGDVAAKSIVETRDSETFISIDDFTSRCKVSQTLIDIMKDNGAFGDIPDTTQMTLF